MQIQITDDMHRHDKSSRTTKCLHVHYNAAHKPIISKSIALESDLGQVEDAIDRGLILYTPLAARC